MVDGLVVQHDRLVADWAHNVDWGREWNKPLKATNATWNKRWILLRRWRWMKRMKGRGGCHFVGVCCCLLRLFVVGNGRKWNGTEWLGFDLIWFVDDGDRLFAVWFVWTKRKKKQTNPNPSIVLNSHTHALSLSHINTTQHVQQSKGVKGEKREKREKEGKEKKMKSVQASMVFVCKVLIYVGVHSLTPEAFRLAKQNKASSSLSSRLWRALHDLIILKLARFQTTTTANETTNETNNSNAEQNAQAKHSKFVMDELWDHIVDEKMSHIIGLVQYYLTFWGCPNYAKINGMTFESCETR